MQNIIETLQSKVQNGTITAAEANVQLVRSEQVRITKGRLTADVRKALNDAVKQGRLGHMKKDEYMPEVYYHPDFENLANDKRKEIAIATLEAIAKVII